MTGLQLILAELQDPSRKKRALAARRLGWRRAAEAAAALLQAAEDARGELCTILDALGWIGDAEARPLAREYAARKLLSRRRSGVEALRNLGDAEGLAAARERAVASLDASVRAVLEEIDVHSPDKEAVRRLRDAVLALPEKFRGRETDTLYELGAPATDRAARAVLRKLPVDRPYAWRYVKSVLKRAMLRFDARTLGAVAVLVERSAAKSRGTTATVKSGRDGKARETPIFQPKTQRYVLRSVWRYLSFMARHRPERYSELAAEILLHYDASDALVAPGKPLFARRYLLHRLLWDRSPRYQLSEGTLRWRYRTGTTPEAPEREEAHPELWDAHPRAYLRLLARSRLPDVQRFALRGALRHPEIFPEASLGELRAMLRSSNPRVLELASDELDRRFDPAAPDWTLVLVVAQHEQSWIRAKAHGWLRQTAHLWTRHAGPTLSWLDAEYADVRLLAGELAASAMATVPSEVPAGVRRELAEKLLQRLREPETEEGRHDAYAPVAAALAAEIDPRLSLGDVMEMLEKGSNGARTAASAVLARRPDAFDALGERKVLGLAEDDLQAVRAAALALFGGARERLRDDPALLFVLVESDWPDCRAFAMAQIGELDFERLGFDAVLALCDSNRVDVQNMGKEWVRRSFEELDAEMVTARLAEHPHRNMRRFVVDLVVDHLEPGAEALARLDGFFRAVLFDLRPDKKLKRRVVDLLVERGLADAGEAAVAAGVLDDALRTSFQMDFEHALAGLARLRLARPETSSLVRVVGAA